VQGNIAALGRLKQRFVPRPGIKRSRRQKTATTYSLDRSLEHDEQLRQWRGVIIVFQATADGDILVKCPLGIYGCCAEIGRHSVSSLCDFFGIPAVRSPTVRRTLQKKHQHQLEICKHA
jgi:hypothetical protein